MRAKQQSFTTEQSRLPRPGSHLPAQALCSSQPAQRTAGNVRSGSGKQACAGDSLKETLSSGPSLNFRRAACFSEQGLLGFVWMDWPSVVESRRPAQCACACAPFPICRQHGHCGVSEGATSSTLCHTCRCLLLTRCLGTGLQPALERLHLMPLQIPDVSECVRSGRNLARACA